jgi:hypothetical protein
MVCCNHRAGIPLPLDGPIPSESYAPRLESMAQELGETPASSPPLTAVFPALFSLILYVHLWSATLSNLLVGIIQHCFLSRF